MLKIPRVEKFTHGIFVFITAKKTEKTLSARTKCNTKINSVENNSSKRLYYEAYPFPADGEYILSISLSPIHISLLILFYIASFIRLILYPKFALCAPGKQCAQLRPRRRAVIEHII